MTEQLTTHRESKESKDLAIFSPKIPMKSKEVTCFSAKKSKTFTTTPKSGRRRPNKKINDAKNTEILRIALSMLNAKELERHVNGLFEGEMTHLSFDIKKPLREELNLVARERGTSVCKILCGLASAFIIAHHTSKNALSNTKNSMNTPIVIESLNFTQHVQSRPRRLIRHEEPQEVSKSKSPLVSHRYVKLESHERQSKDYSLMDMNSLESEYSGADYVSIQGILFELKKRGVDIADFQRRHTHA